MLYSLLLTFYIITCVLLVLVILIQKSKSSVGFGLGSGSQMLFGGSGGQDLFQKITWVLGVSFMAMSLLLSLMKSEQSRTLHRSSNARSVINFFV